MSSTKKQGLPNRASKRILPSHVTRERLDEVYLLILTRRPSAESLARTLQIPRSLLDRLLRTLLRELRRKGFRVVSKRAGKERVLQIERLASLGGAPAKIGPNTLSARKMPARRAGLKPDDEIIYSRDW